MTILAKILLILNLALSLLGLSYAVFVYVTPVVGPAQLDVYKTRAEVGRRTARDALTDRDRAVAALRLAEEGKAGRGNPPSPGELRHVERDWYDAERAHLIYGDPEGTAPDKKRAGLLAIELDDKGMKLDPANGNRPRLTTLKDRETGLPIEQSYTALDEVRKKALAAILEKEMALLADVIRKDTELTNLLAGSDDPAKKLKGLQQQLIEEREKSRKLLQELEDLRPLYVNSAVESELILRRQRALRERYEELLNAERRGPAAGGNP